MKKTVNLVEVKSNKAIISWNDKFDKLIPFVTANNDKMNFIFKNNDKMFLSVDICALKHVINFFKKNDFHVTEKLAKTLLINYYSDTEEDINLYPYQQTCVETVMANNNTPRHLILLEMGLGKTFIAAFCVKQIRGVVLVVAPASMLLNWSIDLKRVLKAENIYQFNDRDKDFNKLHEGFIITSYAYLVNHVSELPRLSGIICDEAHIIRGVTNEGVPSTKAGKVILKLCSAVNTILFLTGSPIVNSHLDLYNMLSSLRTPEAYKITFNNDFQKFAETYCYKGYRAANGKSFKYYTGAKNKEKLNRLIQECSIIMKRSDVFPDLRATRIFIPVEIAESINARVDSNNRLIELIKTRKEIAIAKLPTTIDLTDNLINQNKKVVIFSYFLDVIHKLQNHFKGCCVSLEGEMNSIQRQQAITAFQNDPKITVIAISITSAAEGITLTASHNMIISDLGFSYAEITQAESRILRISQKNDAIIYYPYIINSNVDSALAAIINRKFDTANTVISTSKTIEKELIKLFK